MSTNVDLFDSQPEQARTAPSTVGTALTSSIDDISSFGTRSTTATTIESASSATSHTPPSSSSHHFCGPGGATGKSTRKPVPALPANYNSSTSSLTGASNSNPTSSEPQQRPLHDLADKYPDENVVIVGAGGKKRIISSSLQASLEPSPHALKPQARDAGVSRLPTFSYSQAPANAQMRNAGLPGRMEKQAVYVSTAGGLDMDDSFVVGAGTSARPGSRMAAADLQSWLAHSPFYNAQQSQTPIPDAGMTLASHRFPAPPNTLPPFADSASKLDYSSFVGKRRPSSHASSDWQEEIADDGSVPGSHASGSVAEPAWDDASMVDDGRSIAGRASSVDFHAVAGGTWGSSASGPGVGSSPAGVTPLNGVDPLRSLREIRRNITSSNPGSHVSASPQVSPMQAPSPQMHFYAPAEEEGHVQQISQQSRNAVRPSTSASMASQSSMPHDFEIAALRAQVEQLSKALMKRSESENSQLHQISLPHLQQQDYQQQQQQRRYMLPASPSTLTATSTPTGKSSALPTPSWHDGTNATSLTSRETTDAANKIDDLAKKIEGLETLFKMAGIASLQQQHIQQQQQQYSPSHSPQSSLQPIAISSPADFDPRRPHSPATPKAVSPVPLDPASIVGPAPQEHMQPVLPIATQQTHQAPRSQSRQATTAGTGWASSSQTSSSDFSVYAYATTQPIGGASEFRGADNSSSLSHRSRDSISQPNGKVTMRKLLKATVSARKTSDGPPQSDVPKAKMKTGPGRGRVVMAAKSN